MARRHYRSSYSQGVAAGTATSVGADYGVTLNTSEFYDYGNRSLRGGPMRTTPTLTIYSVDGTSNAVQDLNVTTNIAASIAEISDSDYRINLTSATALHGHAWQWTADARL